MRPGSLVRNQRIVALLAWLVIVVAVEGAVMVLATTDPHGLRAAPTIGAANLARVEPLFGAAWTGDRVIAWSPDGKFVALSGGPTIEILDSATGREERSWRLSGYADAVAWSPDGTYIAVTTLDGINGPIRITVYSDQGFERGSWVAHDDYGAEGLAWSPDGTRLLSAAGGRSGQVAIWETGTWRPLLQKDDAWTTGSSASWSPDGTRFALGGASVAVYRASTGEELWNDSSGDWGRAAWSPREDLIAVGTSSSRLRLYAANGIVVANVSAPTTDIFGTRMSWSPDGSLLAMAANDGIRIWAIDPPVVLRVLSFPTDLFQGGVRLPGNETLDKAVAWSPRGNALAATGSTSLPSFRMWGIRSSPIGIALFGLGAAWVLGLALVLGDDLRFALRNPGDVARTWGRADPSLSIGRALFGIAIGLSVVIGLTGDHVSRITTLQPIPSLSWYVVTGLLSLGFAVPAAVIAARAFAKVAWGGSGATSRPRPEFAPGIFGTVLLPFLVAMGAIPIVEALALSSGIPLIGANATLGALVPMGAVLGVGAVVSARIASGFPGVGPARAWAGLVGSVLASAAVFVGLFLVLVVALNVLRVQPLGDIQRDGITVVFAFGLFPLAIVLGAIAIAATTGLLPTVARILWPGYARLRGERVMALEARKAVMSHVERQPGIHFRDLLRSSQLGSGTVHYHLYVLEREGFITCRRDGIVKRFYPVLHGTPNTATIA